MNTITPTWLQDIGGRAFTSFVRRSDDRRIERTVGSRRGLRVLFGAAARRYDPERAGGFSGELQFDLRRANRSVSRWTIDTSAGRARVREGAARSPAVTAKLTVADFVRMAALELDPGAALLDGRLDVAGDFAVASRLGEMFGSPAAY